jgi:endonuclease/exonuclease/phosphatase (EEP) superfamily protein YafD
MRGIAMNNRVALRGGFICGLVLVISSVGAVFPSGIWLLELVEAFAVHILVFWCAASIVLLMYKRWLLLLMAAAVTGALSFHTFRYYPFTSGRLPVEGGLRVGAFNVFHHNENHKDCADTIVSSRVDVACLFEVSHGWSNALDTLMEVDFAHKIRVPNENCCWGIALFSRYPIVSDSVFWFTRDPVIMATVATMQGEVDIWAVHTRPPIFPNDTEERNALMMMVASEIASRNRPTIVAGDLNIVPWAIDFRRMAEVAGLMDTRRGFKPTFPADFGIPLIPIDHVLHSRHFRSGATRTVKLPGSDHRGFMASMSWVEGQR